MEDCDKRIIIDKNTRANFFIKLRSSQKHSNTIPIYIHYPMIVHCIDASCILPQYTQGLHPREFLKNISKQKYCPNVTCNSETTIMQRFRINPRNILKNKVIENMNSQRISKL